MTDDAVGCEFTPMTVQADGHHAIVQPNRRRGGRGLIDAAERTDHPRPGIFPVRIMPVEPTVQFWSKVLLSYAPTTTPSRACPCRPVVGPQACPRASTSATEETLVAKPNYHQARKQKELARKARQQEKQQRRSARPSTQNPESSQVEASTTPADPTSGSAT